MKIALVRDYLCSYGGSERVFQNICEEFVDADIYTLAYNPNKTYPYFKERTINVTWLDKFVRSTALFKLFFPISIFAMKKLTFDEYDIVISSSATVAKYISVKNGKHICYCYIPTRAIWDTDVYFNKGIIKTLFNLTKPLLKKLDYIAAQNVDQFVAISEMTKNIIKEHYNRNADVILCPIDLSMYHSNDEVRQGFLVVSRLEKWKRVDIAIKAFNKTGDSLKIVGTGPEMEKLKSIAGSNITFLGRLNDSDLASEYASVKAVVFTPYIEYGLIPLEANACGTPVICYGHGGVEETMISVERAETEGLFPTAIFFNEQTKESLLAALSTFEKTTFVSEHLVKHAQNWDIPTFQQNFRAYVNSYSDSMKK